MKTKIYYWKCEDCGLTFQRVTEGEPRRCPQCRRKGAKVFKGEQVIIEPIRKKEEKCGHRL